MDYVSAELRKVLCAGSFAVSGPTISNTLPSNLRGLKTILFHLVYGTWLGTFVTV